MSFFNKIIDRAKHGNHNSFKEEKSPQQQAELSKGDSNRSFFGIHTPHSSTSSSHATNSMQEQPQSQLPKVQEEAGSNNNHYATGYVTPRQSQDLHQNMDIDTPEQINQQQPQPQQQQQPSEQSQEGRSALKQKYQHYDSAIMDQRKNRPKLKLDDFHLLRTLGTGSFGRVHLAQSRHNGRYYAIKVLKKTEVVRLKQVEHTNNEKHILEAVANPFLVNLWGTFQDDANLYMVMDYVPGGELFSVLRKSKRFPDHVAKFYAAEVALAIEYLHKKDVVYRDLKPENLLLDANGHIKITDFGFAKHVPDITWTLCGTPDYLAPEVIQSKGYGKAVDWWSLGILIFEMLAGYPPFYDDDHLKLYEKILQGKIRWPSYFDPNAKDLLKHLLTSDLSRRYGNLKNGADDIKNHPWFQGVDFDRVANRQIRAPYIPQIRGDGDASHFDRYPENNEQYGLPAEDPRSNVPELLNQTHDFAAPGGFLEGKVVSMANDADGKPTCEVRLDDLPDHTFFFLGTKLKYKGRASRRPEVRVSTPVATQDEEDSSALESEEEVIPMTKNSAINNGWIMGPVNVDRNLAATVKRLCKP